MKLRYVIAPAFALVLGAAGQRSTAADSVPARRATPSQASEAGSRAGGGSAGRQTQRSWVMGNIIEAKNGNVSINAEDGTMLTLHVGAATDVALNGKQTSAKDLKVRPGADVFAAYESTGKQPTAVILEIDQTGRGIHGSPSRMPDAHQSSGR